jgi:prepilin-type N-terminal cleavage/methylation domain-containing protein
MFTVHDTRLAKVRRRRGLTLLEVVVGLTILALLAGAIYGIVMGAVESTATLAGIARDDRRVEAFLERTRTAFAHLPAGATVQLKVIEAEPLRQELTLRGVGDAFVWGERGGWEKPAVTIAPQRWPEDRPGAPVRPEEIGTLPARRYSLSMTTPDFYRSGEDGEPQRDSPLQSRQGHQLLQPDIQGRFWMELLPEVERVEWRFYDPAKKIWIEQSPAVRPPLIELRLQLPGRRQPLRAVFETA